MDGGGAGSNLSILKEAKKNYMGRLIFPGGRGPFAYSYENSRLNWHSFWVLSLFEHAALA